MNASWIERIQITFEHAACAMLAAAVALAAYTSLAGALVQPQLAICAACVSAAVGLLVSRNFVARSLGQRDFALPSFEVLDLAPFEPGELLLSEADMVRSEAEGRSEEALVLDDILAELGPDSRVVRLFDRSAMPTPGHLKSRIDDHLGQRSFPPAAPDASQALSDALAELRRSLR